MPNMLTRREAIIGTATVAVSAMVLSETTAADPPGPYDGATTKFDLKKLDQLPGFAFTRTLPIPPTLRPKKVGEFQDVDGQAVFGPEDTIPIGQVFHGTAREWGETPDVWKEFGCDPSLKGAAAWADKQKHFGCIEQYEVDPVSKKQRKIKGYIKNWGGYPIKCYKLPIVEKYVSLLPGKPAARMYTYGNAVPGPMLRLRLGQPNIVRFENHLETEVSVHLHGGHSPSHSDGFPSFYVLQDKSRDYFYPHILPMEPAAEYQETLKLLNETKTNALPHDSLPIPEQKFIPVRSEAQSTMWYHDHGMDGTAYNVSKGLAGMAFSFGEDELFLIRTNVLPGLGEASCQDPDLMGLTKDAVEDPENPGFYLYGKEPYHNPFDIPLVVQDKVIDERTGQIAYDGDAHNGYLGDTLFVNGMAYPKFIAEQNRKYRFRLLNGSNSRIYRFRILKESTYLKAMQDGLSSEEMQKEAMPFLRIGKDSWMFSEPIESKSVVVAMANRADLIVDFPALTAEAKEKVFYLVDTMPQTDGRGPKAPLENGGDPQVLPLPFDADKKLVELNRPLALMRIEVQGKPVAHDATVKVGTTLMPPRVRIKDSEIKVVREFVFERGKGAWQVNKRFYDPTISNASPLLNSAEEWILRNGGGGWWHPIHIHLESHQLMSYEKNFDADKPGADPALGEFTDVTKFHPEFSPANGRVICNHDTQILGPNTRATIRMRFRTWPGPFVFHCHNLEHEDMRMMHNFEPVPPGTPNHDPNVHPTHRTHGNEVTLNGYSKTNPTGAMGELPWDFSPVPKSEVEDAGRNFIEPPAKPNE
jgi:FtsP/CotA-like multicopper oxidase with cupredoxin domain